MRLIDADEAVEILKGIRETDGTNHGKYAVALAMAVDALRAEPVVRCKECNSFDGEECRFHNTTVAPNDYCNYGEKADTKGESR